MEVKPKKVVEEEIRGVCEEVVFELMMRRPANAKEFTLKWFENKKKH